MNRFSVIALLAIAVLLVGCAEVNVRRVTEKDNHVRGFRYYLPRPYVAVKKEYPVAGGEYFITGQLDANNRVVRIDPNNIPAPLKKYFSVGNNQPLSIGFDAIVMVDRQANGAADTAQQPSRGQAGSQQTAAGPTATSPVVAGQDQWLAGSSVTPPKADAKTSDIKIIMKLAKEAGYTTISEVKVALLPVIDGKVDAAKVVLLEVVAKTDWSNSSPGVYAATTQGSQLSPGSYALGLQFNGTKNGTSGTHLIHLSKAGLEVAATGKGEDNKKEESNQKAMSEAGLATSGDPTTSPLQPINDWYDIVLLPDFDQQYAVEIKAGLGKAGVQIGLENGWMLERANVNMDNSEMGRFVFESIEKVLDLGLAILAPGSVQTKSAASALADAANKANAADAQTQSDRSVSVTLKVTYVAHATPGLYPILKLSEGMSLQSKKNKERILPPTMVTTMNATATSSNGTATASANSQSISTVDPEALEYHLAQKDFLYIPLRPYTVVAYNVRETIRIEYISAVPESKQGETRIEKSLSIDSAEWNVQNKRLILEFKESLGSGGDKLQKVKELPLQYSTAVNENHVYKTYDIHSLVRDESVDNKVSISFKKLPDNKPITSVRNIISGQETRVTLSTSSGNH